MTIIDFHTHFFPDALFRAIWKWFDAYGWGIQHKIFSDPLIHELRAIGVSKMVLLNYAHKPGMSQKLNRWTREFADRHPEIIPFGTVHPCDEDPDKIVSQCFGEHGFHGLKLHAHVLKIAVDDPLFFPIYEQIEEAGKILVLHAGNGPKLERSVADRSKVGGAERLKMVLKRCPNLKLVLPHLGADEFDECFDLMEEHENLWMDTTMTLAKYFVNQPSLERIEEFSDRILYGSDAPNVPYDLDTELNNIREIFPVEIQKKLFFENAQRLLGLEN